jgi:capsid protein
LGKGGKSSNIAEININRIIYNDRKQIIAEHLNDYFVNIGLTLAAECERLSDYEDLHCNSTGVNSKFYFHTITETNILKNLKNLELFNATGADGIPAKMLKLSCDIIAPSLTYIFNLSISTGIYVDDWKRAREYLFIKQKIERNVKTIARYLFFPLSANYLRKKYLDSSINI